jgi:hypothetical protein
MIKKIDPKWVTSKGIAWLILESRHLKMVWLILGTERCGRTGRINVVADVHVKVSHVKECDVNVENRVMCSGAIVKGKI